MDSDYALTIRFEAYEVLSSIRGVARQGLLTWMETIQKNPFSDTDYKDKDTNGDVFEIKVIGRYAVFHYVDHAVKEVKIVKIVPSDR